MNRKDFLLRLLTFSTMTTLSSFNTFTRDLPLQSKKMPVLFTSHGNPMDIPLSRNERPFWNALYTLGAYLQKTYEVKAAVVVSAHWCTKGTFVNSSLEQKQIYDYYGFPKHFYDPKYKAKGDPLLSSEISKLIPSIQETSDWGLDHGAWPMLMHLFPDANIPVFQLSIDYHASPDYHYSIGQQLKSLRDRGVLVIGSGSLIHNLPMAIAKMRAGDSSPYGWEVEYDAWLKEQIDQRNIKNLINYENSHKLGKTASPTPDHYVPILYSLGLMDTKDTIDYFYELNTFLPAFSERSFVISQEKIIY